MDEQSNLLSETKPRVQTRHHWFRSGSHSLLGHLDRLKEPAQKGVVIVPPFGWEDICSYRPLRSLGRTLAAKGFPTLRFDLPGTGDSSGTALDYKLFGAWIQSIQDAVAALRRIAGVQHVTVLGVRLGAMLALAASSAGMQAEDLILWGASATGHMLLRELRAFRNLEVTEYAEGEVCPPAPIEGLEVAGFLLSRETESDIEAFTALNLKHLSCQHILLLSRDSFPHDSKLVQSIEKVGCQLTLKTGFGYQKMMAEPHEPLSFVPETEDIIADFLRAAEPREKLMNPSVSTIFREDCAAELNGGVMETVVPLSHNGHSLFAIVSQHSDRTKLSEWGLLFMNAGGVRHIGPNRMWVEAARRWAGWEIPSVRLDFSHVGESDGDQHASIANLHGDDLVQQLSLAMEALRSRCNCQRFIAVGLCSGAFASFQSLIRNPSIRGAVLFNPRLFFWDPAVEPRRLAKRMGTGLGDMSDWRRLVRGDIQAARIKQAARFALTRFLQGEPFGGRQRQIPAEALEHAWAQVTRFGTRVTLVFADGEPLIQEMIDEQRLPPRENFQIQCLKVGKVGHTFRALWAQQVVQDIIDREIKASIQDVASSNHSRKLAFELSTASKF